MRIMHNYPQKVIFLDHNLKLYKMIEMHSKYDNMHTNGMFNALICINNYVNLCVNCMLSNVMRSVRSRNSIAIVDRHLSESWQFTYVAHSGLSVNHFKMI